MCSALRVEIDDIDDVKWGKKVIKCPIVLQRKKSRNTFSLQFQKKIL